MLQKKRICSKKIDYEGNMRWLNNQPESFRNKINIEWKRYIHWKDPDKVRSKEERQRMSVVFTEAVVIGILDIG